MTICFLVVWLLVCLLLEMSCCCCVYLLSLYVLAVHLFSSGQVVQNKCNNTNCCALWSRLKESELWQLLRLHHTLHSSHHHHCHILPSIWFPIGPPSSFIASLATVIAGSVAFYYWPQGEALPEILHRYVGLWGTLWLHFFLRWLRCHRLNHSLLPSVRTQSRIKGMFSMHHLSCLKL